VDLAGRVNGQLVNKKVLESLVRCGACDPFGLHRARLFSGIDFATARAVRIARDRQSGQGNLFEALEQRAGAPPPPDDLPDCPPWSDSTLLASEKELLGTYLSGHPLSQHAAVLKTYQLACIADLAQLPERALTRIGGIAATVVKRLTKQEPPRPMAIVQLEDLSATIEVVVYPDTYAECASRLGPEAPLLVCGAVSHQNDRLRLIAAEVYPLVEAPRHFCKRLGLHLATATLTDECLARVKDILARLPGQTPVTLCVQHPDGQKVFIEARARVTAEPGLVQALEAELGESGVFVAVDPTPCRRTRSNSWARSPRNGSAP
jgi:DNA polymerase-3 subunit alpha